MSGMKLRLMCLVWPDDSPDEHSVAVKIDNDDTVADLKELIRDKHAPRLDKVAAPDLVLWKCSGLPDDNLEQSLKTLQFDGSDVRLVRLHIARRQISQLFEGEDLSKEPIHILVEIPAFAQPTSKMRVKPVHRLSEEDTFSRLKRAKLATTAPSTIAKPSEYESMQTKSNEKILDDRPEPDDDIPPIPLLYDGFGHFLDILDGDTDIPGLDEVDSSTLRLEVDDFARKMCCFYTIEDDRRDKALPVLDKIFAARSGVNIPTIHAAAIGSVRSDGHSVGKHGGAVLATEFKNRVTGINGIPEVELVGYVARSHVRGMEKMRELFERWRVPCLGLTVVGSDVKFYAVIVLDSRYRLVGLTPALSCIRSASDGRDRKALYAAFTAASVLQARILQDVDRYLAALPPKIPDGAHRCPAISRLRRYGSLSDDYLTFEIRKLHPCKQSHRLLYIAETEDLGYETILVKFVRGYSAELHAFCADSDHAPRILAFDRLPGGWLAVAMEYISSGVSITTAASSRLASCRERWTSQLWKLVKSFHDSGFVHGDLRDPNIICDDKDRVLLIDFDWSGKEGQVSYPTPNLNEELLAGRILGDLKITKADDERVLHRTLDKLKM